MLVMYEIEFWDEIEDNRNSEKGIAYSENEELGNAVNRIVKFYGKNNVINIKVIPCEDVINAEEAIEILKSEE